MGKIEKLLEPPKSFKTPTGKAGKGAAGYDNPRENIDPQIKTKVLHAQEIVLGGVRRTTFAILNSPTNVKSYRSINTPYQNTGTKTIHVTVGFDCYTIALYSAIGSILISSNGIDWSLIQKFGFVYSSAAEQEFMGAVDADVPPNWYYKVIKTVDAGCDVTIDTWYETEI